MSCGSSHLGFLMTQKAHYPLIIDVQSGFNQMNILIFFFIFPRISYIRWDNNEVNFILFQQAQLDFNYASSLKPSLQIDISLHSVTLSRFRANQSLFFLLNVECLAEKQQIPIFGVTQQWLEPTICHMQAC